MKKKMYCVTALALALVLSLAGCGSSIKPASDSSSSDTDYSSDASLQDNEEPEESGQQDNKEPEESGQQDNEEPEESGQQDNEEPEESGQQDESVWEISFTNGKGFDASKYDLELVDTNIASTVNSYEVQTDNYDVMNILEAALRFDTTATELADSLVDNIRESSGETPLMDIHQEGVYVTGIHEGMIVLAFITDGPDDTVYVLCLYSTDMENCIDILNSIIDDFLASDITENGGRTEYGEPVN